MGLDQNRIFLQTQQVPTSVLLVCKYVADIPEKGGGSKQIEQLRGMPKWGKKGVQTSKIVK